MSCHIGLRKSGSRNRMVMSEL